jgi:hypothetical protein
MRYENHVPRQRQAGRDNQIDQKKIKPCSLVASLA